MIRPNPTNRVAWSDRWSKPSVHQLLEPLKFHHRRCFNILLERLGGFDDTASSILWYGPSWKWTIHFALAGDSPRPARSRPASGPDAADAQTLCYLVPNTEHPLVCVPLTADMIESLPKRRLSKFIRDGISAAKCAVTIHWAMWSPTTESEVGLLIDLLRRKHEFELEPEMA